MAEEKAANPRHVAAVESHGEGGPHESSPPRHMTAEAVEAAGETGLSAGTVTETLADLPEAEGAAAAEDEAKVLANKFNREQLEEIADRCGVEDPEDYDTKRELAAAILEAGYTDDEE